MHGGIDLCQFGRVAEVRRFLEHLLVDGANERERRIQHDGSLDRLVHILVGVADGDRTHGCRRTATHAKHAQRNVGHEDGEVQQVVDPQGMRLRTTFRTDIQHPQHRDDEHSSQHEIPVVQQFYADDAAQVLLVAELVEHRHRGPSAGVLEIDGIDKVHDHAEPIDDDKDPLCHRLPGVALFPMLRKEHEHDVEHVGIENGRRVEHPRTRQQVGEGVFGQRVSVGFPVLQHKCHTAEAVRHVRQHHVAEKSDDR